MLYNRPIAVLRAPLLGMQPADRARHTEARLAELLAQRGPGVVSVTPAAGANAILIDGKLGILLAEGDASSLDGQSLDAATRSASEALRRVVAETREARSKKHFWEAVGQTGVATLTLFVLALIVLGARRWLERRLVRWLQKRMSMLPAAGKRMLYTERLFHFSHRLVQMASWLVLLLAGYRWLSYALYRFPYTRPWAEGLDDYLLGVAARIGGGIVHAMPDLVVAAVILALAYGVNSVVRPLFDGIVRRSGDTGWLDADTAKPTRRIISLIVWVFAIVMAYPYLPGASSEAFKGASVLIGLMVTLGGSSLFGQAASGLILLYSRTLRLGEFVRVGEHEGTVTELGVFTTRLATGRGEDVTLPNAWVLATVTKNYSRPAGGSGFVLRAKVTIGYDTAWRQVEGMLLEAARATPGIGGEPTPRVFQTALSDFYVEYELICRATQTSAEDRAQAGAMLNANVIDTFNRYGVQIMSPHYFTDPARPKTVAHADPFAGPAAPRAPGTASPSSGTSES
jgi:small-conductance mechanosensitive channel